MIAQTASQRESHAGKAAFRQGTVQSRRHGCSADGQSAQDQNLPQSRDLEGWGRRAQEGFGRADGASETYKMNSLRVTRFLIGNKNREGLWPTTVQIVALR